MFRAINIKEKAVEERVIATYANSRAMLETSSCHKTSRMVKKIHKSGLFKIIENIKGY